MPCDLTIRRWRRKAEAGRREGVYDEELESCLQIDNLFVHDNPQEIADRLVAQEGY